MGLGAGMSSFWCENKPNNIFGLEYEIQLWEVKEIFLLQFIRVHLMGINCGITWPWDWF